jgi:plastocyanin
MNTYNSFARYTPLVALLGLMYFVAGCGTGPDNNAGDAGKLFDSGNIAPGESFSFTFEEAGTVEYFCDIHPNMQGRVTVASDAEISGRDTVDMVNTQFNPSQITIAPNTEIVWTNSDGFAHTVVDGNP